MAKATTKLSWSPWIWNVGKNLKSNYSDGYQFGDFLGAWYGFNRHADVSDPLGVDVNNTLSDVVNNSREQYLEDRAHTEMREDTAYQRGVEDMRRAGLNPYTIGGNPAPSSASSVGDNTIMSKLQAVGYTLDLQNLSLRNKSLANQILGNILGYLGTRK